jgi:hypothetical protein
MDPATPFHSYRRCESGRRVSDDPADTGPTAALASGLAPTGPYRGAAGSAGAATVGARSLR